MFFFGVCGFKGADDLNEVLPEESVMKVSFA